MKCLHYLNKFFGKNILHNLLFCLRCLCLCCLCLCSPCCFCPCCFCLCCFVFVVFIVFVYLLLSLLFYLCCFCFRCLCLCCFVVVIFFFVFVVFVSIVFTSIFFVFIFFILMVLISSFVYQTVKIRAIQKSLKIQSSMWITTGETWKSVNIILHSETRSHNFLSDRWTDNVLDSGHLNITRMRNCHDNHWWGWSREQSWDCLWVWSLKKYLESSL